MKRMRERDCVKDEKGEGQKVCEREAGAAENRAQQSAERAQLQSAD